MRHEPISFSLFVSPTYTSIKKLAKPLKRQHKERPYIRAFSKQRQQLKGESRRRGQNTIISLKCLPKSYIMKNKS